MANKSIFFTDGEGIYKVEKFVKAALLTNLETKEQVTAELVGSTIPGFAIISMPTVDKINAKLPTSAGSSSETKRKTPAAAGRKPKGRKAKSGYYGVSAVPNSKKNPWRAVIFIDGVRINIGGFPTDVAAAKAVDDELIKRGLPARNFPQARKEG